MIFANADVTTFPKELLAPVAKTPRDGTKTTAAVDVWKRHRQNVALAIITMPIPHAGKLFCNFLAIKFGIKDLSNPVRDIVPL